jgi:hypothetical protein
MFFFFSFFKVLTPTSPRMFQCLDIDTKKNWMDSFDDLRKRLAWEKSQKLQQSAGKDASGTDAGNPSPPDSPAPPPRERVGTILRKKEVSGDAFDYLNSVQQQTTES